MNETEVGNMNETEVGKLFEGRLTTNVSGSRYEKISWVMKALVNCKTWSGATFQGTPGTTASPAPTR